MQNNNSLRVRLWGIVETAKAGDKASRLFDIFILSLIALNVLAVINDSIVPSRSIRNQSQVGF